MTSRTVPARNPRVVFRELADGEGVLLHLDTGAYHGLNATGTAIWELVDGARAQDDIVAAFEELLDDPPDGLDDVVATFLAGLHERDLIG